MKRGGPKQTIKHLWKAAHELKVKHQPAHNESAKYSFFFLNQANLTPLSQLHCEVNGVIKWVHALLFCLKTLCPCCTSYNLKGKYLGATYIRVSPYFLACYRLEGKEKKTVAHVMLNNFPDLVSIFTLIFFPVFSHFLMLYFIQI